eukprot:6328396-Prymnesium_polylepis.1
MTQREEAHMTCWHVHMACNNVVHARLRRRVAFRGVRAHVTSHLLDHAERAPRGERGARRDDEGQRGEDHLATKERVAEEACERRGRTGGREEASGGVVSERGGGCARQAALRLRPHHCCYSCDYHCSHYFDLLPHLLKPTRRAAAFRLLLLRSHRSRWSRARPRGRRPPPSPQPTRRPCRPCGGGGGGGGTVERGGAGYGEGRQRNGERRGESVARYFDMCRGGARWGAVGRGGAR